MIPIHNRAIFTHHIQSKHGHTDHHRLYVLFFFYLVTFKGGSLVLLSWQSFGEIFYEFDFGLLDEQIRGGKEPV